MDKGRGIRTSQESLRIAIMGQAAFGAKVLETLSDRGEEIIAAWLPQGKAGGKPDPLKTAADSRGIPSFQPQSYRTPETLEAFRSTNPDLLIMAFVTDIIPPSFFGIPTQGAICYHPSILPRHRGGSAINWAVIMGDRETGLSIFWADAGIDTGPVLLQKRIPIGPEDTTGALYFNRLFPLGVEAIVESVELIKEGRAPRMVQDERLGHLRTALQRPSRPDRLGKTRNGGPQPHPGLRSPAWGLLLLSGEEGPSLRDPAGGDRPVRTPDRERSWQWMRAASPSPPAAAQSASGRSGRRRANRMLIAFAAETGLKRGEIL